eukprot:scaffold155341_cov24-Tisochrysis_lutea.AAC.2
MLHAACTVNDTLASVTLTRLSTVAGFVTSHRVRQRCEVARMRPLSPPGTLGASPSLALRPRHSSRSM